jgi:hypothetical protein
MFVSTRLFEVMKRIGKGREEERGKEGRERRRGGDTPQKESA